VLIQGDCRFLPMRADTVDLIVTSPPYDDVRDYHGHRFDHLAFGAEAYRVAKSGAICAVVIGDSTKNFARSMSSFSLAVDWTRELGWRLYADIIYSRAGRPGAWWNTRFRVDHEYLLLFLKGDRPKTFDKSHLAVPAKRAGEKVTGTQRRTDGATERAYDYEQAATKCRGTIWHYAASNTEPKSVRALKGRHPATFPDALAADVIQAFSRPGDIVVDPMTGSGTVPFKARQLGRVGIGMDLSTYYLNDIAKERLGC